MVRCPECGADVPDDGRFCPACGLDLDAPAGAHEDAPHSAGRREGTARGGRYEEPAQGDRPPRRTEQSSGHAHPRQGEPRGYEEPPQYEGTPQHDQPPRHDQPGGGRYDRPPRAGYDDPYGYPPAPATRPGDHKLLLGGVVTVSVLAALEGVVKLFFADALVEVAAEEGLAGPEISEGVLMFSGGLGVAVALAIAGLTAYYYREGELPKRFFWVLLGTGVAGLLLVGSLFVTVLALFGIYGLVVVAK